MNRNNDSVLSDLKSKKLIHLKGWLFLMLGFISAATLIAECYNYKVVLMLAICVWSFCRFYYYAFYVIEKYVDPGYKFSGLISCVQYIIKRNSIPND